MAPSEEATTASSETATARLVAVAFYDRDRFSQGHFRKVFGYEAYHWGIMIMPEPSQGPDCHMAQTFEATDATEIDPTTFRMINPTMDWWLRETKNVDLAVSSKLLGRIVIGQVSDGVSSAELRDLFDTVPLPVKNTHPQQSCVTWVAGAIRALQRQGWVWEFELDRFKDEALAYADERLKELDESNKLVSKEPSVKYYGMNTGKGK